MNCHEERAVASLRVKYLAVFNLLVTGGRKKKSDFRLTRSRHPSASGRRISRPPGDGMAARRDPKANSCVFYRAGL